MTRSGRPNYQHIHNLDEQGLCLLCGEVVAVPTVPGKKADAGKPPAFQGLVQYFPNALLAVAAISAYGVRKYDLTYTDKNWLRVVGARDRYRDALLRHLINELNEGPTDPESGLPHAAHMAWCALAYLELLHGG